jgi:hypothetical protein
MITRDVPFASPISSIGSKKLSRSLRRIGRRLAQADCLAERPGHSNVVLCAQDERGPVEGYSPQKCPSYDIIEGKETVE